MGKTLKKAKLDKLIEMIREYWTDLNIDLSVERLNKMHEYKNKHFPKCCDIMPMLNAILSCYGLKKNATNEDIYKVLEVLGWEIKG